MASDSHDNSGSGELFLSAGKEIAEIPVIISYRIIELFSDGLYASPTKAVEELVSNSFDAGAKNVHVILSPDPTAGDALIAVTRKLIFSFDAQRGFDGRSQFKRKNY